MLHLWSGTVCHRFWTWGFLTAYLINSQSYLLRLLLILSAKTKSTRIWSNIKICEWLSAQEKKILDSKWDFNTKIAEIKIKGEIERIEWGTEAERIHWKENKINKAGQNQKCDDYSITQNGEL